MIMIDSIEYRSVVWYAGIIGFALLLYFVFLPVVLYFRDAKGSFFPFSHVVASSDASADRIAKIPQLCPRLRHF